MFPWGEEYSKAGPLGEKVQRLLGNPLLTSRHTEGSTSRPTCSLPGPCRGVGLQRYGVLDASKRADNLYLWKYDGPMLVDFVSFQR